MRTLRGVLAFFLTTAALIFAQGGVPTIATTSLLPAGVVGNAYSLQFQASNPVSSWSISGLPPWASFNPSNGVLSGTPNSAGSWSLTLSASNAAGIDGPRPFTLVVLSQPICNRLNGLNGGPTGWSCSDSGNPTLNGRALSDLTYNAPAYGCGDTIILAAGAQYYNIYHMNGQDLVRSFRFSAVPGCASGQQIRIVSSQLANIPDNLKTLWPTSSPTRKASYAAMMAQLVGVPGNVDSMGHGETTTANLGAGASGYYFGGIAIVTPVGLVAGSMSYIALGTNVDFGPNLTVGSFAQNIEIDRCFVGDPEDYIYGSVEDWYNPALNAQADVNTWQTFFRAGNIAVRAEGDNWNIHDSVIVTTGFDPSPASDPEFSCNGGTNSRPAILSCPGVAAALGIGPSNGCSYQSPAYQCYPGSAQFAVFRGAAGGWTGPGKLNGAKYLVYVDADHVAVYEAWRELPLSNPTPIDSSSWGAYAGSVQGKATSGTAQSVQYGIVSEAGNYNVVVENNFISDEGGSSNIFLGGGWVQTDNRGTVLPGSTCSNPVTAGNTCVVNMNTTSNLNVGDWIWLSTAAAPKRSVCCPSGYPSNNYCAAGVDRAGIVTAINGNSVSVTGANAGFSCVDPGAALDIGGPQARWNGRTNRYWKVSANTLQRQPFGYGKAYVEVKHCQQCLFTGNRMCCTGGNDIFVETHMQGNDPWVNASSFEYSYNLLGSSAGSPLGFFEMGQDPESSNMPSTGMRLIHNMSVNMLFLPGYSHEVFFPTSGSPNVTYAHNTFLPQDRSYLYLLYAGSDACVLNGVSLGSYFQSPGASINSNIVGYGGGLGMTVGVCDPFPTGINNNLFLNDLNSPMPGWVGAQNNTVVNSKSAIGFVGTCTTDSYVNCALANSSRYKGSAPDGGDPGADVYAVQDRQNRWSEWAGLIIWKPDAAAMVNNPAAFNRGATHMAMQFRLSDSLSNCSVRLFTDRARTRLHPDTAMAANQACARIGNQNENGKVTFVFGTVAPLTPGATYAYQIIDGRRVMVGEFTTATTEAVGPVTTRLSDSSGTGGN